MVGEYSVDFLVHITIGDREVRVLARACANKPTARELAQRKLLETYGETGHVIKTVVHSPWRTDDYELEA